MKHSFCLYPNVIVSCILKHASLGVSVMGTQKLKNRIRSFLWAIEDSNSPQRIDQFLHVTFSYLVYIIHHLSDPAAVHTVVEYINLRLAALQARRPRRQKQQTKVRRETEARLLGGKVKMQQLQVQIQRTR